MVQSGKLMSRCHIIEKYNVGRSSRVRDGLLVCSRFIADHKDFTFSLRVIEKKEALMNNKNSLCSRNNYSER